MIQPLRDCAAVVLEGDDQARLLIHGCAEFNRRADRIRHVQGATLVRDLDPLRRQAGLFEKGLRLFQIVLGENAHADALGSRLVACALEHEAVVACLGNAAEIERVTILVADDEADEIDVEAPAAREILHRNDAMAGARHVERWIVDRLRNAHRVLPHDASP